VHEEALACELAGHFMLESGEGRAAFPYFLLAQKSTVNGEYLWYALALFPIDCILVET